MSIPAAPTSTATGRGRIFIVGCARSGTTWMRAILGQHPAVVTGPESHLFPVLYEALSTPGPPARWRARVLARYDARAVDERAAPEVTGPHHWVDRPTLEALLHRAEAMQLQGDTAARFVLDSILSGYFEAGGGGPEQVLVEKTPRHLMFADRILGWWPDARVVEVVRDGRDVCVSMDHKSRVRAWAPADRREQIRRWTEAVLHGARLRGRADLAPRWHLVRYEDVRADASAEIARLLDFLELPYDQARVHEIARATAIERARLPGTEHHIRTGVVGGWRRHLTKAQERFIHEVAGRELAALGYEV